MDNRYYYIWANGYEDCGIVRAKSIRDAKKRVIKSQGKCESISVITDEDFDEYDVISLIN